MSPLFENVREQLLREGVAPRHVGRYVTELREHLTDLAAHERATGSSPDEAEQRATNLLGNESQLVQAMLDKGAPRSIAARAPWSVFTVLPVLLFVLVLGTTASLMMSLLWPFRGLSPSSLPAGYALLIASVSFATNWLLGPLLAAGCILAAVRQRMRSLWVWIGFVMIAVVSGPLGFHMNVLPSVAGGQGNAVFSVAGVVYADGRPDLSATLVLAFLRAAALFALAAVSYRALQHRIMSIRS